MRLLGVWVGFNLEDYLTWRIGGGGPGSEGGGDHEGREVSGAVRKS